MAPQGFPDNKAVKRNLAYWSWKAGNSLLRRYTIQEVLDGSLWRVMIVDDSEEEVRYAVKTFKNNYLWADDAYERFEAAGMEWVSLGKVDHLAEARFVKVIDGLPCIFMEYYKGCSLADLIGNLPLEAALAYALQICTVMDEIFRTHGKPHKDITAGNVFIAGEQGVRLMDYGLVRVFDSLEVPESWKKDRDKDIYTYTYGLTRTGYGLGFPLYMSREMETNRMHNDIRADIYSFGVLFVEMLCSKDRRGSEGWKSTMGNLYETLRRPEYDMKGFLENRGLPASLVEIVARTLAKNIENRFASFEEITGELLHASEPQQAPQEAIPTPPAAPSQPEDQEPPPTDPDLTGAPPPDLPAVRVLLREGEHFLSTGEPVEALRCFNAALELNADDEELWAEKGKALYYLKRYQEAIKSLSRSLHKAPANRVTWLFLGNTLADMGRKSDAIECYNKALSLDSEDSETWKKKGMAYSLLGSHAEAIECFDEALAREPGAHQTMKQRALSLISSRRYREALQSLVKALELSPDDGSLWNLGGKVLEHLSRRQEALEAYEKALRLEPHLAEAWCNKGMVLGLLGRQSEAINAYNRAIVEKPRFEEAWNHKGEVLMSLGRNNEAAECFNIVLDINPRHVEAWSNKGILLKKSGKTNEAIECFSKALAINPSAVSARRQLYSY